MGQGTLPSMCPTPPRFGSVDIPANLRRRLGLGEGEGTATGEQAPAWLRRTPGEPRWQVMLAVLVAIGLQLLLPPRLAVQPRLLLPALEASLVVVLLVVNPGRIENHHRGLRYVGLALVGLVTLANAGSAVMLIGELLHGGASVANPAALLAAGGAVYGTNVIAFALWYWETDRGGPAARAHVTRLHPDFLFPQMVTPEIAPDHWEPRFFDYLYLSFTNATAFSPTDTMPLSRWAKALMTLQSAVALVVVALVVARAVNILR